MLMEAIVGFQTGYSCQITAAGESESGDELDGPAERLMLGLGWWQRRY